MAKVRFSKPSGRSGSKNLFKSSMQKKKGSSFRGRTSSIPSAKASFKNRGSFSLKSFSLSQVKSKSKPSSSESDTFIAGGQELFDSVFSHRPVLLERPVDFSQLTGDFAFIKEIFVKRGWVGVCSEFGHASENLVREFYSNMHNFSHAFESFDTKIRGMSFSFTVDSLATYFHIDRVPDALFPNLDWMSLPPPSEMAKPMRDAAQPWFPGMSFKHSELTVPYRILNLIVDSVISPAHHCSDISEERVKFLYCLTHDIPIDLPSLLFKNICNAFHQKSTRVGLPYGVFITNLLKTQLNIVRRVDEMALAQDKPINRVTISRTIAQKKPTVASADPHSSGPSMSYSPSPSIPTDPLSSSSPTDPHSVIVFALNALTNRITHLEKTLSERITHIEQVVQSEIEGTRIFLLSDLHTASQAATYCKTQTDFFVTSLGEIASTTHTSLASIGDKVNTLVTEVGDLMGVFNEIKAYSNRGRSRY